MRRIGVLMSTAGDDPESQLRLVAFVQGLQQAGWTVGCNVRIDVRWSSGDFARLRKDATDLLALGPRRADGRDRSDRAGLAGGLLIEVKRPLLLQRGNAGF